MKKVLKVLLEALSGFMLGLSILMWVLSIPLLLISAIATIFTDLTLFTLLEYSVTYYIIAASSFMMSLFLLVLSENVKG